RRPAIALSRSLLQLSPLCAPSSTYNATATPATYPLSLHDALPISQLASLVGAGQVNIGSLIPPLVAFGGGRTTLLATLPGAAAEDRKSTRLNSSHGSISYAVFCLKKKTIKKSRADTTTSMQENQQK